MAVRFEFDFEKALAVLSFFASMRSEDLTKGTLCKLMFLADRAHVLQ
jgi:hypothetical protein